MRRRWSIPNHVQNEYEHRLFGLLDGRELVAGKPRIIGMTEPARDAWLIFAEAIEAGQGERGALESIGDWSAKLPGAAARPRLALAGGCVEVRVVLFPALVGIGLAVLLAPGPSVFRREAAEMLAATWAGRKINGFRSLPAADREAVMAILARLAQLALDFPEIAEIEINPVRALPGKGGAFAIDVRARLASR